MPKAFVKEHTHGNQISGNILVFMYIFISLIVKKSRVRKKRLLNLAVTIGSQLFLAFVTNPFYFNNKSFLTPKRVLFLLMVSIFFFEFRLFFLFEQTSDPIGNAKVCTKCWLSYDFFSLFSKKDWKKRLLIKKRDLFVASTI